MGGSLGTVAAGVGLGALALTGVGAPIAAAGAVGAASAGVAAAAGGALATAATVGGLAATAAGAGGILSSIGSVANLASKGSNLISQVSGIGGALTGAASTYAGARSNAYEAKQAASDQLTAAENYEFQSGISLINKDIAERNLDYEIQTNFANAERTRRQNRRTLETAKSAYAVSGVTATGSVQDVLSDQATEGELNIAMADYESRHRQMGFRIQRDILQKESDQYLKAAAKSKENSANILKEALAAQNADTSVAFLEGVQAIPAVLSGIGDLANYIGAN